MKRYLRLLLIGGVFLIALSTSSIAQPQHGDSHHPTNNNGQDHHNPLLIVVNDSHDHIHISVYDEEHRKVGTWEVDEQQRITLKKRGDHGLQSFYFNSRYEVEIEGSRRSIGDWAQRSGENYVIDYHGGH